jgi:hypothetical protein
MSVRITVFTLTLLALAQTAQADPVSIFRVRDVLDSIGQKGSRLGILSGQPMVSGDLQGLGTVVALNKCNDADTGEQTCEEVNFKACVRLLPWVERLEILEAANDYNLKSYAGSIVLDSSQSVGPVACILMDADLRDGNVFDTGEAYKWAQALTDFRSYLKDQDIPVLNPNDL